MGSGIASMLIMPEQIIRAHLFVGKSFLHPLCYDIEEDDEEIHDPVTASGVVNANNTDTIGNNGTSVRTNEDQEGCRSHDGQEISLILPPIHSEIRRAFIIDEFSDLGTACFIGMKGVTRNGPVRSVTTRRKSLVFEIMETISSVKVSGFLAIKLVELV